MTEEDYKYRQGRSKHQADVNEKVAMIAGIGLMALIVGITIYNLIVYGL
jgi:uncharacterized membrane-anchored protein